MLHGLGHARQRLLPLVLFLLFCCAVAYWTPRLTVSLLCSRGYHEWVRHREAGTCVSMDGGILYGFELKMRAHWTSRIRATSVAHEFTFAHLILNPSVAGGLRLVIRYPMIPKVSQTHLRAPAHPHDECQALSWARAHA